MDYSGEAAERIVRISIDGAVIAAKITGEGAKRIAVFLSAALNDQNKLSGAIKLASMLKSGKELKVFTLTDDDFDLFKSEVKRFGVTYCVLRDKDGNPDTPVEFMVKAEDASKIQRIFERLGFGQVDTSDIEAKIDDSLNASSQDASERSSGASETLAQITEEETENPFVPKAVLSAPSEPISERQETEGKVSQTRAKADKKSIKKVIAEIKKERADKFVPGKDAPFTKEEQRYFRKAIPVDVQTTDLVHSRRPKTR